MHGRKGNQDQHHKAGFTFTSRTTLPMMIVLWGDPANQGKLQFPARGIQIALPFEANGALARVVSYTDEPVRMQALDPNGNLLGGASTPQNAQGSLTTLEIQAEGMTSLELSGGGNEALLVELCIYRIPEKAKPALLESGAPGAKPGARKE